MQRDFLACGAYEVFAGGAAGPGKSEGLVVAPLRWVHLEGFRAVLFRNTFPELERTLIAKSRRFYPQRGGKYRETSHAWTFPSGAEVTFAYLERDADVHRYQGAEFSFVGFDELPHFTEYQYRYLGSRLRSATPGLPVRLRATGNPDGPHLAWVRARFADWIEGRVPMGESAWYDPDGKRVPKGTPDALSRCYIPGKLAENHYVRDEYRAQLLSLDPVTRAKLLEGDWDAAYGEGKLFHRDWWVILDALPSDVEVSVRAWDLGATAGGDPTRGVLLHRRPEGASPRWVVSDVVTVRGPPGEVAEALLATADRDGKAVTVCIPQDPGQAGLSQSQALTAKLEGYRVEVRRPSAAKVVRWGPVSSQVYARNVGLVRGPWTTGLVNEGHAAPDGPEDDQLDALADAYDVALAVPSPDPDGYRTSHGGARRWRR